MKPDRYFETSGRYPYERSIREVEESYSLERRDRLTRVSYDENGLSMVHVGSGYDRFCLDELNRLLDREEQIRKWQRAVGPLRITLEWKSSSATTSQEQP